jgi:hypothetical protein
MSGATTPAAGGRVLGLDGKSYPGSTLSPDDQRFLIGHVHAMKHLDGLSVRQIVSRLDGDLCIRRSVGWVSTVLSTWTCEHCTPGVQVAQNDAPEHPADRQEAS